MNKRVVRLRFLSDGDESCGLPALSFAQTRRVLVLSLARRDVRDDYLCLAMVVSLVGVQP
jgi:hypothetical protein